MTSGRFSKIQCVEYVYPESRDNPEDYHRPLGRLLVHDTQKREGSDADDAEYEYQPGPRADVLHEPEPACITDGLDCHREADMEDSDPEGQYHLLESLTTSVRAAVAELRPMFLKFYEQASMSAYDEAARAHYTTTEYRNAKKD